MNQLRVDQVVERDPDRSRRLDIGTPNVLNVRSYLYVEDLAALTPWTPAAIRTMMARGVLKLGLHYFKPTGPNGRAIFSWSAIRAFIEGREQKAQEKAIVLADGRVINLDEAAQGAKRLLG